MGIRLALGATRANLYRLVFRQGFALALAGLAVGFAAAASVTHVLESLLFETSPADPASWGTMVIVVVVSTGIACVVPARRAAAADPTATLRSE